MLLYDLCVPDSFLGRHCLYSAFFSLSPSLSQSHEPPTGNKISNSSQELPSASFDKLPVSNPDKCEQLLHLHSILP